MEAATGIRRSNLYNTFGSKRRLFDAAVQSYLDEVIRPRLSLLQAETVSSDAIIEYLTGLREAFENLESMPATNGCLLINMANSSIASDPEVARVVTDYRNELETAFARGIEARQPALSVAEKKALSKAVTGMLISAYAIARIDPAQAASSVDIALRLLRSSDPSQRE